MLIGRTSNCVTVIKGSRMPAELLWGRELNRGRLKWTPSAGAGYRYVGFAAFACGRQQSPRTNLRRRSGYADPQRSLGAGFRGTA